MNIKNEFQNKYEYYGQENYDFNIQCVVTVCYYFSYLLFNFGYHKKTVNY